MHFSIVSIKPFGLNSSSHFERFATDLWCCCQVSLKMCVIHLVLYFLFSNFQTSENFKGQMKHFMWPVMIKSGWGGGDDLQMHILCGHVYVLVSEGVNTRRTQFKSSQTSPLDDTAY